MNVKRKVVTRNLVQKLPKPYIFEGITQKLIERNQKLKISNAKGVIT
jgi:hypothetical protein